MSSMITVVHYPITFMLQRTTLTHFLCCSMPLFLPVAERCSYRFSAKPTSFSHAFSRGTD